MRGKEGKEELPSTNSDSSDETPVQKNTTNILESDHLLESNPSIQSLPPKKISEISAPPDADWEGEWIAATCTRNYLLRDPVIDWFAYNYSGFVTRNPSYTKDVLGAINDRRNPNSFTEYIMEQGCIFEDHVLKLLIERFGKDLVVSVGGELNARSPEKIAETIDAMNRGIPIIHSGLLHNPETKTYGIPDLIVRSDWINNIVKIHTLDKSSTRISAPRLRDINRPSLPPKFHYLIVDIKFSTLCLRADGIHLLNSDSFPAYKSQLYIYNEALALIQGYNPNKAFILGRKWKFTSMGEIYKGKSCFDRLGTIDYEKIDKEYVEKTEKALKWIRECRTDEAKTWNITSIPLERAELYPNMSNTHDYPWHNAKNKLAEQIKELTSLWMVGTKQREKAHEEEVYQWTDENCTPEILGITGKFTSRILDRILEINQPHRNPHNKLVLPESISNNFKGWQNPQAIEFYVDFETVNDVLTDFEALPNVENTSLIFMIGVGYIEPISKRWSYREFTVNKLTFAEEEKICRDFAEYIRSEAIFYNVDSPLCVHWAPAEDTFWNDAVERHHPVSDKWRSEEWEWLDLLKIFKEEPIVVKGALGFSLKCIARALHSHGLISSTWEIGNPCLDGQGAMVGAWRAHKEAQLRGLSMREVPLIKEIVKYNHIDVKVLQEIISYLRNHHILDEPSPETFINEDKIIARCPNCQKNLQIKGNQLTVCKDENRKRQQSISPEETSRKSKRARYSPEFFKPE